MIQIQRWLPYTGILITYLEGSIYVEIPADHPKTGTISRLWVNESSRHKGAARHLLATAEEQAKYLGCKKVYLCWTEGEAEEWTREWYERNGYKEVECRGIDHWYAKSLLYCELFVRALKRKNKPLITGLTPEQIKELLTNESISEFLPQAQDGKANLSDELQPQHRPLRCADGQRTD